MEVTVHPSRALGALRCKARMNSPSCRPAVISSATLTTSAGWPSSQGTIDHRHGYTADRDPNRTGTGTLIGRSGARSGSHRCS